MKKKAGAGSSKARAKQKPKPRVDDEEREVERAEETPDEAREEPADDAAEARTVKATKAAKAAADDEAHEDEREEAAEADDDKEEAAEEDDEAYLERESDPPPRSLAPQKSGFRKGLLWAGVAVLLVLAVVFVVRRMREPDAELDASKPRTPLSAVPDGAFVVATLDLVALRKEPLSAPFLSGEREVPGLGPMKVTCGFDPLAMVDRLAIGIPDGPNNDFGVSAMGRLDEEAIVECARKIIAGRGGTPVTNSVGRFRTVRDATDDGSGEIAIGPTGHLLFGGGTYLRSMMDAAEGKLPDVSKNGTHEALKTSLAGHEHIQASLVLSTRQRRTVADELAQAKGRAPDVVAHITGAAIGVRLAGDEAHVLLVLRAESASHVAAAADLLSETLSSTAEGPAVRLIGASDILKRVKYETQGENVRALLTVSSKELLEIAEKANRLSALMNAMDGKGQVAPPEP